MGGNQSYLQSTVKVIRGANIGATIFWSLLTVLVAGVVAINCYSLASINGAVGNSPDIQKKINDATLSISLCGILILFFICVWQAWRNSVPQNENVSRGFGRRR
jgi:hypothetical protein